ncbi:mechanosensitive ion channel family protein [Agromyces mangrovi Wang et al. 2018]|uniref:mechanosensitive ion channel family protein n=1 Tax=Agromyces mangrovi TaxID=1858653 RepID=UPI0025746FDE|nr:mechanosensitive ion channel domain-containing protein [Agromyces mangrovi]BDZ64292.1 mechanosensitive ion channel protein MscS [Agromyces mangrovi]
MDDLTDTDEFTTLAELDGWTHLWAFLIALGISLLFGVIVIVIARVILALIRRKKDWPEALRKRAEWPFRVTILLMSLIVAFVFFPIDEWVSEIIHWLGIALIASGAWLACQIFLFLIDTGVKRYRIQETDTVQAARIRTQLQIVRRLVVAVIVVVAVGSILVTFPSVRAVGASVLASAGIASIVAGLAAQTVLGNVFAGVQLAFSDAIRVGDVVVVEGEWGRINQITLSYVVVDIWDQRSLVLPCTYFTSQPFENWTKTGKALLGTVEFDLDWRVSTTGMRKELDKVLAETDLWDGVASGIQVTDATGGYMRVRVLVSAEDSAKMWDLRCLIREELSEWMRDEDRDALPLQRVLVGNTDAPEPGEAPAERAQRVAQDRTGLFSGTPEAQARAEAFTSKIEIVDPERVRIIDPDAPKGGDPTGSEHRDGDADGESEGSR